MCGDIFNDLDGPVFQGHGIFEVEYLKISYGQSYYRTLIGNRTNLSNGTGFNALD